MRNVTQFRPHRFNLAGFRCTVDDVPIQTSQSLSPISNWRPPWARFGFMVGGQTSQHEYVNDDSPITGIVTPDADGSRLVQFPTLFTPNLDSVYIYEFQTIKTPDAAVKLIDFGGFSGVYIEKATDGTLVYVETGTNRFNLITLQDQIYFSRNIRVISSVSQVIENGDLYLWTQVSVNGAVPAQFKIDLPDNFLETPFTNTVRIAPPNGVAEVVALAATGWRVPRLPPVLPSPVTAVELDQYPILGWLARESARDTALGEVLPPPSVPQTEQPTAKTQQQQQAKPLQSADIPVLATDTRYRDAGGNEYSVPSLADGVVDIQSVGFGGNSYQFARARFENIDYFEITADRANSQAVVSLSFEGSNISGDIRPSFVGRTTVRYDLPQRSTGWVNLNGGGQGNTRFKLYEILGFRLPEINTYVENDYVEGDYVE